MRASISEQAPPLQVGALSADDAARYLGLERQYLTRLRMTGGGPRYGKIGHRLVVYRLEDLDAWLASKTRASTSEMNAAGTS